METVCLNLCPIFTLSGHEICCLSQTASLHSVMAAPCDGCSKAMQRRLPEVQPTSATPSRRLFLQGCGSLICHPCSMSPSSQQQFPEWSEC